MYSALRSAILLFVTLSPLTMAAQTNLPLTNAENKTLLSFQYQHPFFKSTNYEFTALSGTYDLSLVAPVSPTLSIVGTLPYAAYSASTSYYSESFGALANISIGLQQAFVPGTSILQGKVFLPTAPTDGDNVGAIYYGMFHRMYDIEQYIPNTLGMQVRYNYQKNFNGLLLGGLIGGTALIPTGNNRGEMEVLARYGVSAGYENKDVRFVAEFIGVGILTEENFISDGKTEHFIAIGGQWTGGSVVKPKINIHLPLGSETSRMYSSSLMLGCDFVLP
ncbi:MAG: hypothetical protein U0264_07380 [Candidatus Kapaibacterium sp.]